MNAISPVPRPRRWIGFFVVLAVLGAAAIITPVVYNLGIQLRPEQVANARRLWADNPQANYDLEYLVKITGADAEEENQYLVKVRDGRTVFVAVNGEVLGVDPALAVLTGPALPTVSPDVAERFGVPALLEEIDAVLRQDTMAGRRNFATAGFDPTDGHPYHYVHRVRGTRERVEWNVKLTRLTKIGG